MSDDFYKNLPTLKLPIEDVFNQAHFSDVPLDWHVIITDVKNSTAAVKEGRHHEVNLIAATSLIIALNIAKEKNIEIPFFFSGDGGTVIVPPSLLEEVTFNLMVHNANSVKNFSIELHVGSISMKDIQEKGHFIKIVKTRQGKGFSKAIVIGDGLRYAEDEIKNSFDHKGDAAETDLNLEGLECRWDKIKPPQEENEVVCFLIESVLPEDQLKVYREVMIKIKELYGSFEKRNPLSLSQLKLTSNFNKLKNEMLVKYGKWSNNHLTATFLKTFIGQLYFRLNLKFNNVSGKEYLNQIISNADTFIVDGRINTIITGKQDKRESLISYLNEKEKEGKLIYGYHISKESIMTCYIENRNNKHIHFVDGSDGGYTEAAKDLKRKMNQIQ